MAVAAAKKKDLLDQFVEFLNRTNGRDKLCRTIQYGCRMWLGLLQDPKYVLVKTVVNGKTVEVHPKADSIETLTKVMGSMSMCRKILRFGRTAGLYRQIVETSVPNNLISVARLGSKVSLFLYFFFDHISWAQAVGVLKLDPATAQRINRLSDWFWFGEVLCSLCTAIYDYQNVVAQLKEVDQRIAAAKTATQAAAAAPQEAQPTAATVAGVDNALAALQAKRKALLEEKGNQLRAVIRNVADFPLTLSFVDAIKLSLTVQGFLGTVSSVIGCYDVWPKA